MSDTKTTNYARPEGSRDAMRKTIECLRDFVETIGMPQGFAVKARNLIIEIENERNKEE